MHTLILTTLFALLPATSSVDHDRVEKYARDLTVETGCVVITGEALMLTACDDKVSWCVDGWCGTDPYETTWGCQYFPEEGPADDIAVCILSSIAIKCCECLSVCPDEGDEE